jgi:selenocysteine lyase/cysteine desulfurase
MIETLASRSDFPILEEVTYLNTASIALTPRPVRRAVEEFESHLAGGGTVRFDDAAEASAYEPARTAAARLLNSRSQDIAITTSMTEALNQLAWWLRPGPGANVVAIDIDFPSVTYAWMRVAQETGCEVRLVAAQEDPASLSFDDIAALVDDRTAAICVSHVQYATGLVLDVTQLTDLAHAHGALLILDATQSAGMVPIDVAASGVDAVLAGGYKWLCAAFGAAICYLSPALAERFVPPFIGWRSVADQAVFDARHMRLLAGPRAMEYSTVAYGSGIALGAALEYLLDIDIERILDYDRRLANQLYDGLERLGATVITPRDEQHRAGIVAARFPDRSYHDLAARLANERVYVSPRLGGLRYSPHFYNTEEDVARALEVTEWVVRAEG